jgi:antitoxin component of MazEF toxin-antitoxin module
MNIEISQQAEELPRGPSLAELLHKVTDSNLHAEHDWGERQGNEAW